jgi:outer membrane protein assembly factor BamB
MIRAWCVVSAVILTWTAAAASNDWPQFRGSSAGVAADDPALPETWSTSENVAWAVDVPGLGWSSPVVWGDQIFITSVISSGKATPPQKGLFAGTMLYDAKVPHRWMVYAIDFATGRVRWERELRNFVPPKPKHLKNSFASETPVTDGERVYVLFADIGLFAFDMQGNLAWAKEMTPMDREFGYGSGASPVVHKNRVYIVNDNEAKSFVAAYDARTGAELWRIDRDEESNWSTPFVWEHEQRTEIVTAGTGKVRSYDLDGKLLWELKGMTWINVPTPFARHGLLYISSGWVGDAVRPVYAIRPGASGDISLKEGETANAYITWYQRQLGTYNTSPLVYGDYFYTLFDRGFLACHDARTGKQIYGRQRIAGDTSGFTASPWAYNGRIFVLSEDGDTFVIQAGPEFKVLGKNSLDEMVLATPAVARGSVIIRTQSKLYRIAKRG